MAKPVNKPFFPRVDRSKRQYQLQVAPAPTSHYVPAPEPDGVIYRYMAPSGGELQGVTIHVEHGEPVEIDVRLSESEDHVETRTFKVKPGRYRLIERMPVAEGLRVTVALSDPWPPEEAPPIRGIWISFLFQPTPKGATAKLIEGGETHEG